MTQVMGRFGLGAKALLLVVLSALSLAAQSPDYTLSVTSATGGVGSRVSVEITLEVGPAAEAVDGWSFSLAHDPQHTFVQAVGGPDLESLNGGVGPDFVAMEPSVGGWIAGVVVDFQQAVTLPAGTSSTVHIAEYDLAGPIGTTPLEFTTLGNPAIPPLIVTDSNLELLPTLFDGTLTVEPYLLSIDSGTASVGGSVDLAVRLSSPDGIDAFDLGIGHDPSDLTVVDVVPAAVLAATGSGAGPDLYVLDIVPDGYTLSVVIDTSGTSGEVIPASPDVELVTATYEVVAGATTPVDLTFSPTVGSGVATVVGRGGLTITPDLTPGSITLVDPSIIRGDCDVNGAVQIADPVVALAYLFTSGPGVCLDACDVNADGTINIGDPIVMLEYLFISGPPPAPPFPACAPNAPILGCTEPVCP